MLAAAAIVGSADYVRYDVETIKALIYKNRIMSMTVRAVRTGEVDD
jgi:hypothetical protein